MADITLEQFEGEAQAFLEANAPRREEEKAFVWGEGSDKVSLFDERDRGHELELLKKAQAWRAEKFDAGYGWITGPSAYGGRELPHAYQRAWDRLESQYEVPASLVRLSVGLESTADLVQDLAAALEAA